MPNLLGRRKEGHGQGKTVSPTRGPDHGRSYRAVGGMSAAPDFGVGLGYVVRSAPDMLSHRKLRPSGRMASYRRARHR